MILDPHETIAAIATPPGPALRGIVRVSGPQTIECLSLCFRTADVSLDWKSLKAPTVVLGTITGQQSIPCQLYLWPSDKSYTRQPTAEIHTFGSQPILEEILEIVCHSGARLAQPGEFTLRAFLAGRIDLTQAEAVLGLIDAQGDQEFETSLQQLAGGLSRPFAAVRETLLMVLTELEAGLDFADEDIEFISAETLSSHLASAAASIKQVQEQLNYRSLSGELPRIVLTGAPNAGKSSLFNALVDLHGTAPVQTKALVSAVEGTTRDYLIARLDLDGLACELVDTAGIEVPSAGDSIAGIAQTAKDAQCARADLLLRCHDSSTASPNLQGADTTLQVFTKADLTTCQEFDGLACSSVTGFGLSELCERLREQLLIELDRESPTAATTTIRCAESLTTSRECLDRALALAARPGNEELIATDVRAALNEIGQIVGAVYTDDLLDRIFGQFCIGK